MANHDVDFWLLLLQRLDGRVSQCCYSYLLENNQKMHLEHLMDVLSSTRVSPVEGRKDAFERLNQSLQKAMKDLPKVDHQYAEISGVIEA